MTIFHFSAPKPETAPASPTSKQKTTPPRKTSRRLFGRHDKSTNGEADTDEQEPPLTYSPVKVALSEDTLHGSETEIGIEISLDWDEAEEQQEADEDDLFPIVLSLERQMQQRNKVHRSQFSTNFPALQEREEQEQVQKSVDTPPRNRRHRVPLWDTKPPADEQNVLQLLEAYHVQNEVQAIQDELERTNAEIKALQEDQRESTPKMLNLTKKGHAAWDVHEWLALGETITSDERQTLEERRGLCFSFHISDKKAREALMTSMGWKQDAPRSLYEGNRRFSVVSLNPENCEESAKVSHVALLSSQQQYGEEGFFMSRDRDKASTWGSLPPRLFQKLKGAGFDARHDLMYLSTGPQGCYYAEFRSGDTWWGNALKDDAEFQQILLKWHIYRVAFGPIVTYNDDDGHTWTTNSWIILGRDGRAAWKNIPARLQHLLESRLADWPAPAEITLGSDDSYFVRFLDGTIDYCLPAEVANVCEYIESRGGRITDMTLHPDVSQDFVIRHSEIQR